MKSFYVWRQRTKANIGNFAQVVRNSRVEFVLSSGRKHCEDAMDLKAAFEALE